MDELSFLQTALPEDWAAYPRALMEALAQHAARLRRTVPWCAALSEEAYQQYVLCPRVNDEDLPFWWPRCAAWACPPGRCTPPAGPTATTTTPG